MTSNRPYLLRAFNEWILDNEFTPHIVVEADMPHVHVPPQTIKDGQVVLNINPSAVHMLEITNEQITFSARFGGVPFEVYIPMYAVSAIYARENGAGTMFPPEELDDTDFDNAALALSEDATQDNGDKSLMSDDLDQAENGFTVVDSKATDSSNKPKSPFTVVDNSTSVEGSEISSELSSDETLPKSSDDSTKKKTKPNHLTVVK